MFQDRAPLSGTTLDKYELMEKVGEGGMAEVYRGRHTTLGRIVAVKVLHPHLSSTERNRLRFEREARAIESLHHDNILRIFDYSGRDSHTCFIVTEFIEGVTLKEMLNREGRLPSELVATVGIELCRALTYAHERNIIHRDIKPENVMIRNDGVVKLMDFGIARVLDESTMTLTGGLVGSPAYMSPEQASDGDIDYRSDLFSVGTLLYRSATGHLPFTGGNAPVILRNILEGLYVDPLDLEPGLSPALVDIIKQCLSRSPADRPQTAAELEKALHTVLTQAGMEASTSELVKFMANPVGYQTELKGALCQSLPIYGKQLIETGDKVTAMRIFNRVLYLDEQNEQVRVLIQQLYQSAASPRRRWGVAAGVSAALLMGVGAWWSGFGSSGAVMAPLAGNPTDSRIGSNTGPVANAQAGDRSALSGNLPGNPSDNLPGNAASSTGGKLSAASASESSNPASALRGGNPMAASVQPETSGNIPPAPSGPASAPAAPTPRPGELATGSTANPASLTARGLDARRPERLIPGSTGTDRPGQTGTAGETGPDGNRKPLQNGTDLASRTVSGTGSGTRSSTSPLTSLSNASDGIPALVLIRANYQAELSIGGKSYGNTMLLKNPVPLPAGEYALKLTNELCEPFETTIRLKPGQIFEQQFELKPLPARLFLQGGQPDAEVFVDGQRLGVMGSLSQPIPVKVGRDQVQVVVKASTGREQRWTLPELSPRQEHHLQVGP